MRFFVSSDFHLPIVSSFPSSLLCLHCFIFCLRLMYLNLFIFNFKKNDHKIGFCAWLISFCRMSLGPSNFVVNCGFPLRYEAEQSIVCMCIHYTAAIRVIIYICMYVYIGISWQLSLMYILQNIKLTQKSGAFLYTKNDLAEKEIKRTLITISSNKIKHLEINLTRLLHWEL